MINKSIPQPVNVVAGQTAILTVPNDPLTLIGLQLLLSGTNFDKTKIDAIKVKVGSRVLWDLTYAQVQAINQYKNDADVLSTLYLDFTERDQAIFPVKEVGGLDLPSLRDVGQVTVEIKINGAAVNPKIDVTAHYEASQGNPIVLKYVPFTAAYNTGGKFTLPIQLKGAVLKRLWVFFSGTAWTATTNGNVQRMEIKKNSMTIFDQYDKDNRFIQSRNKKVPQAGLYCVDFIVDNNHDAQITTAHAEGNAYVYDNFEFNAYLLDGTGAALTCIAEVLDSASNL
jgi:hypothetical protein